jgi:hypothetical protein
MKMAAITIGEINQLKTDTPTEMKSTLDQKID